MEEYIMDVEIDNERTTLKTFSNTVEGAVDNVVMMEGVQKLFNIDNTNTQETWEFEEDIKELRELRNQLPKNIKMFFSVGEN